MILKNLLKSLENEGVRKVKAEKGIDFDHNIHHAIEDIESDEMEPGKIVEVKQEGYYLKDKLLRPASVVVSKDKKETKKEETNKEESIKKETVDKKEIDNQKDKTEETKLKDSEIKKEEDE